MNRSKKNILYPDNKNGIYLYEYPEIGGIKQYVQVRGEDRSNPIMLFIHGGPGSSVAGTCHVFQSSWEKHFTVVNWDQRNTCKTYLANKSRAVEISRTGTMEDYIRDVDEIIAYLHTVCEFEKIILTGFSWGSAIGAEYARRHPENLYCYIAVGQLVNYRDGILEICRKMLEIIPEGSPDRKKVNAIAQDFPAEPVWDKQLMKRIKNYPALVMKYIAKHTRSIPLSDFLTSPFLNMREIMLSLFPDRKLLEKSYETMLGYDFRKGGEFTIPTLFIFGNNEIVCPSELLPGPDAIGKCESRTVIIPAASHTCFLDQPVLFENALLSFVEWKTK